MKSKNNTQTRSAQENKEINTIKINSIRHRWSQKIILKHNRYIEQCHIGKNKEYEVYLSMKNFLMRFSRSRETWNIRSYAYKRWPMKPISDEKTRKWKQHPIPKCSSKEIKRFSQTTKELRTKTPNIKRTNKHKNQQIQNQFDCA